MASLDLFASLKRDGGLERVGLVASGADMPRSCTRRRLVLSADAGEVRELCAENRLVKYQTMAALRQ